MKRLSYVLSLSFLLVFLPGNIAAQGLLGLDFRSPYSLDPGYQDANFIPTISVGWVDSQRGVPLWHETDLPEGGTHGNIDEIPYRGVWLGGSILVAPLERSALELEGGALLNNIRESVVSKYNPSGPTTPRTIEGLDTGYLQAMGIYKLNPIFEIMAGFRWDIFSGRVHRTVVLPEAYKDFRVNAYLPLIGFRLRNGSVRQHITMQAIGTPIVCGSHRELFWQPAPVSGANLFETTFTSGYMGEVTAKYDCYIFYDAHLSLLGKWDYIQARSSESRVSSTWANVDNAIIHSGYSRSAWTLGIEVSTEF